MTIVEKQDVANATLSQPILKFSEGDEESTYSKFPLLHQLVVIVSIVQSEPLFIISVEWVKLSLEIDLLLNDPVYQCLLFLDQHFPGLFQQQGTSDTKSIQKSLG